MENDGERSVPCSRRERCPLCAHAPPRARVATGRAASVPRRTSPGRNGAAPNAWSSTNQPSEARPAEVGQDDVRFAPRRDGSCRPCLKLNLAPAGRDGLSGRLGPEVCDAPPGVHRVARIRGGFLHRLRP